MHTLPYGPFFSCRRLYTLDSVQALRTQPAKAWIRRRRERRTLLQGGFHTANHGYRQVRFQILCSCGTSAGSSNQVPRTLARVTGRFAFLDQPPLTPVVGRLGVDPGSRAPDVFEPFQDRESRVHQLVDHQTGDWKHASLPLSSSLSLSKSQKSPAFLSSQNLMNGLLDWECSLLVSFHAVALYKLSNILLCYHYC